MYYISKGLKAKETVYLSRNTTEITSFLQTSFSRYTVAFGVSKDAIIVGSVKFIPAAIVLFVHFRALSSRRRKLRPTGISPTDRLYFTFFCQCQRRLSPTQNPVFICFYFFTLFLSLLNLCLPLRFIYMGCLLFPKKKNCFYTSTPLSMLQSTGLTFVFCFSL